jgi:hypothetical protein
MIHSLGLVRRRSAYTYAYQGKERRGEECELRIPKVIILRQGVMILLRKRKKSAKCAKQR